MKRIVCLAVLLSGCAPVLDAQLQLIGVARKGLADVGRSVDQRQRAMAALEAAERSRLDAAFDADVHGRPGLTGDWVIEARTAYAAAIDAFARRRQQSERAAAADAANLAAIDAALQQVQTLDRAQLQFNPFSENK